MQLGIDFGTCFSSAAAILPNGTLMRVKDPTKQGFSFPSSVYVTPANEILVGFSAEYQRNINPQRYCREFKRKLGQNTPYQLGKRQLLPEELVTEVLRKLKTEADEMLKAFGYEPLTNCVITIPATYNNYKNDLMQQAAENAGFVEVTLLPEPVATAIYCAQEYDIKDGEIILVYDLGGGTFDCALMQKHGTTDYKFLGIPVGEPHCGGIDFDREIYKDFNQNCSESLQNLLKSQQQTREAYLARSSVADDCREIKHQLSEADEAETSVIVPGIGTVEYYQLNREKFNGLIEPLIQKTIQLCQEQVTNANLTWEKVDRIVMVGGSCRIPYIKELLEQEFGRPTYLVDEPDLAVCLGAAIYGMQLDAQLAQPIVPPESNFPPKNNPEELYKQGLVSIKQENYKAAVEKLLLE